MLSVESLNGADVQRPPSACHSTSSTSPPTSPSSAQRPYDAVLSLGGTSKTSSAICFRSAFFANNNVIDFGTGEKRMNKFAAGHVSDDVSQRRRFTSGNDEHVRASTRVAADRSVVPKSRMFTIDAILGSGSHPFSALDGSVYNTVESGNDVDRMSPEVTSTDCFRFTVATSCASRNDSNEAAGGGFDPLVPNNVATKAEQIGAVVTSSSLTSSANEVDGHVPDALARQRSHASQQSMSTLMLSAALSVSCSDDATSSSGCLRPAVDMHRCVSQSSWRHQQQQHHAPGQHLGNSHHRGKRIRTIFTADQLHRLEAQFERQQYMVGTERYYLASSLRLTEAQVKVWFQNRRIKWRKQSVERQQAKMAVVSYNRLINAAAEEEEEFDDVDNSCSDYNDVIGNGSRDMAPRECYEMNDVMSKSSLRQNDWLLDRPATHRLYHSLEL